jgi:hypothetical protein
MAITKSKKNMSSIRGLTKEYARNHRYVVQGGRGKGSNYSLNSEGLATAKEIMATVFEGTESAAAAKW